MFGRGNVCFAVFSDQKTRMRWISSGFRRHRFLTLSMSQQDVTVRLMWRLFLREWPILWNRLEQFFSEKGECMSDGRAMLHTHVHVGQFSLQRRVNNQNLSILCIIAGRSGTNAFCWEKRICSSSYLLYLCQQMQSQLLKAISQLSWMTLNIAIQLGRVAL
jgi:hypothetical protein